MHDTTSGILFTGLGLVFVLVGFGVRSLSQEWRRQLRRMPRTLVREAHPGPFVKMAGRVVAREPVHAPLADADCVYFRMTMSETIQRADRTLDDAEGELVVSSDTEYASGWELEDETGRIEVQPEDATFLHLRVREFSPGVAPMPGIREDLLARYRTSHEQRVQLSEERLEQGASVVMLGWLREGPRGTVLTGGTDLRVFGEREPRLLRASGADWLAWGIMGVGLLLAVAGASEFFREPAPLPNLEMTPLPRPPPGLPK